MNDLLRYRLWMGGVRNEVRYLGYPLLLTPTEYRILRCIAESEERGIAAEALLMLLRGAKKSTATVAVHICTINRKAYEIGQRRLILSDAGKYYLNECM